MSQTTTKIKVLFVCMGNICRSPTAEGILTSKVQDAGLIDSFEIDSAGTTDYHTGLPPDDRAIASAMQHGYSIENLRARQVYFYDFDIFDYILAMDRANLSELRAMKPPHWQGQLSLMLDYHPSLPQGSEVPDPYFGGQQGFARVIDMLEQSSDGLLKYIMDKHDQNLAD